MRGRRVAALAAMAGLLLQLLAVVMHTPGWSRLTLPTAASGLQAVLICTAFGTQSITLDADGNPTEIPSDPGDSHSLCPICSVPGSLALVPPVAGPALDAPPASVCAMVVAQDALRSGRDAGIHRNCGPPLRSIG